MKAVQVAAVRSIDAHIDKLETRQTLEGVRTKDAPAVVGDGTDGQNSDASIEASASRSGFFLCLSFSSLLFLVPVYLFN